MAMIRATIPLPFSHLFSERHPGQRFAFLDARQNPNILEMFYSSWLLKNRSTSL
jgi:hypothetical protein